MKKLKLLNPLLSQGLLSCTCKLSSCTGLSSRGFSHMLHNFILLRTQIAVVLVADNLISSNTDSRTLHNIATWFQFEIWIRNVIKSPLLMLRVLTAKCNHSCHDMNRRTDIWVKWDRLIWHVHRHTQGCGSADCATLGLCQESLWGGGSRERWQSFQEVPTTFWLMSTRTMNIRLIFVDEPKHNIETLTWVFHCRFLTTLCTRCHDVDCSKWGKLGQ